MSDRYRDRPFPPDDRDYNRAPHQQGADDPLAELARLIGQTDPYSSFGRQTAAQPAHAEPAYDDQPDPHDNMGYDPHHDDPPLPAWMRARDPAPSAQTGDDYGYPPASQEQTYNRHSGYRLGYEVSRFDQSQQEASYAEGGQHYADGSYDQGGYRHDAYGQGADAQGAYAQDGYAQGGYDQTQYGQQGQDRYDQVLYGEQPRHRQSGVPYAGSYEPDYAEEAYDQGYGEPEQQKRRGGMMTVAAVLALAVIGTAGAYAYRSIAGSPRSGEPPIIKADAGPSKVVPAKQSGDKQIYDRVGDKSGERMVPREEQPVEVDARSGGPRVVFPPLTQNPSPPSGASVSPAARPTGPGVANGTLSGEAPRRIRTISIHPADQTDVTSHTPAAAPPAPAPVQTMAARAQAAAPQAAPSNAPMALAPQAAPEPRSRVASLGTAPAAAGSYVQVSSQRSEADAMTSYKILQGKYPGILGSRQPTVRRADLGSKGVYYRALVGPFASTEDATQFCVNLQSAGGKCIVQRN
jgi:hypothetical protein